ncbi:hypothetical protein BC748_1286 [Flavobacterium dankookense]|uniref:Uncharacterized protein n=1 Tax=Flavobacterium dankookense TaxID=706186 RepID=A0A4V3CSE2_9FLAO|nr:hypothetical protein BC748_1286 [Flavobacterium dankookense]
MEEINVGSSLGLVIFQILSLVFQISVIFFLYRLILWIFKKSKKA